MTINDVRDDVRTMASPRVSVQFEGMFYSVSEIGRLLVAVDRLWLAMYGVATYYEGVAPRGSVAPDTALRPPSFRMRVDSPPWLEIAGNAGVFALTYSFFAYALRHPGEVGSWIPRLVAAWHDGWTEVERARRDRALAKYVGSETEVALERLKDLAEENALAVAARRPAHVETENVEDHPGIVG